MKLSEEHQSILEGFVFRWGKREALKALGMRSVAVLDDVIAGRATRGACEMVARGIEGDLDRIDGYLHAIDKAD